MSDIGLYGICAAMMLGVVIVVLVLRKWTKPNNKFGISDFGLLLVGLIFLTIGVWGSLEITFGDLTLLTHRDFTPSTQAEVRHESGQPTLPENSPTPRPGAGPSNRPPPNPALPRGNPAQAAEQFARLSINPSTTVNDIIGLFHVPFCAERNIILSSADDLRLYLESDNHDNDIGRAIVSVVETQVLRDVDFNVIRWIMYYEAPAKEMIVQCVDNGIASLLDHMVTLCVRMVDLKKEVLIEVIVDRQSRLIKLAALSAPTCTD